MLNDITQDAKQWREGIYFAMNDFYRFNGSVDVECDLLMPFGIDRVVVTNMKLPPLEGFPQLIPFELELISDETVELELSNL